MKTNPEVDALLAQGWTVEPVLLYDEEGVDGWEWADPRGRTFAEVGDHWEPPPLPEEPRPPAEQSPETRRYIAFLDSLLRAE